MINELMFVNRSTVTGCVTAGSRLLSSMSKIQACSGGREDFACGSGEVEARGVIRVGGRCLLFGSEHSLWLPAACSCRQLPAPRVAPASSALSSQPVAVVK